jgi:hypothetical protein
MKNKILFAVILISGLTFVCQGNPVSGQTTKGNLPMKDTVRYTCTHHPEVVSNKPGKCPKCGMELVSMKSKEASPKSGGMKKSKMKKDSAVRSTKIMKPDKTKVKKDTAQMKIE